MTPFFDSLKRTGAESATVVADAAAGLRAVIAVGSTKLGPAAGKVHPSPGVSAQVGVDKALEHAERLSRAYAVIGANLGGGEIILCSEPPAGGREFYFRALGRAIERLSGRFLLKRSVYLSPIDMGYVALETDHLLHDPLERVSPDRYLRIKAEAVRSAIQALESTHTLPSRIDRVLVAGCGETATAIQDLLQTEARETRVADTIAQAIAQKKGGTAVVLGVKAGAFTVEDLVATGARVVIFATVEDPALHLHEAELRSRKIVTLPGELITGLDIFFAGPPFGPPPGSPDVDPEPFRHFAVDLLSRILKHAREKNLDPDDAMAELAAARFGTLERMR